LAGEAARGSLAEAGSLQKELDCFVALLLAMTETLSRHCERKRSNPVFYSFDSAYVIDV
jgi:hypothetical protein